MTKIQLNQKEQHYADTREQAEEIISAAKEHNNLQMHKLTEKHNKYGQYFLIDLTFAYQTPKEVMESSPDDAPDGQISLYDHEGIEYSVDSDGTASVNPDQLSLEEEVLN
ncbi:organic solvent tolerance protein OstA [Peribacillus glennii]|uniref:Organic solvent tolerance protein OstA n=1 Tax=Peribacillus glennii TaxID=2303991 RepID=A0A372L8G4_9BACI|nr:organic solvent tolerance protein OstA [Peribacillus glennii]RFU61640.1 organic solvent tolerance protein OstA [Peribacillus glennii]